MKTLKIFFILTCAFQQLLNAEIAYPDFIASMLQSQQKDNFDYRKKAIEFADPKFVKLFIDAYEKNIAAAENDTATGYRIPRIVHQIWLGSPTPEKYHHWMKTWANLKGWEYKLWTDEEVSKLSLHNQDLYDRSSNFGEKSDILRLEILERFGGLYVDTDFECYNVDVLDELNRSFDFYIGFEPLEHGFIRRYKMFKICNALIAAKPHHPLINDFITNLKANYYAYLNVGTIERTGPSYLTRIICSYEQRKVCSCRNMYMPSSFFYPLSEPDARFFGGHPESQYILAPETAAIHYWNQSWVDADNCYGNFYISNGCKE